VTLGQVRLALLAEPDTLASVRRSEEQREASREVKPPNTIRG
jgi:hypothetical protein